MSTGVKLPTDPKERKKIPIFSGVLKYFPDALAEVAKVSWAGNEQHNPGEPLHWAREKSTDQEDTLIRHLMEAGTKDTDGQRHSAKMVWRALAILQLEIEAERKDAASGTYQKGLGGIVVNVPNNQPSIITNGQFAIGACIEGGTSAVQK
jgi:hypothetical protein